ncbi:MFS transporter [Patulibacter defluvii]|uniref:MFS transporter n=1 Tax=Patulibacter defluvii TaxID=3095358 RepID=UPI002A748B38|nr:MFS transporter [Patulibacter sp. DM4]
MFDDRCLRRGWTIWGLAASAYFVAIFHRMALGVAGLEAADRLDVGASALAYLAALQLLVYLAMQVPAGLAADRFGPRRTLAVGLLLMAAGEALFAVADGLPAGLAGRALVGVGDALTFLNVLRIAHAWFPGRMQGLLAALTGFVGALGQLLATAPLHLGLEHLGWTATFLLGGAATALLVLVPLMLLRDRPPGVPAPERHDHLPIVRTLVEAARRPATRHGWFLHVGAMAPFAIVGAVWGVPYMVESQGMTRGTASTFLLAMVLGFAAAGPTLGLLAGHHEGRQRWLSVALPALPTVAWTVLLAWPGGTVPRGVLLAALALTGIAGGGAMMAFEIARRDAPPVAAGATGALVNCGGFLAAPLGALAIGPLIGAAGSPVAVQHAMVPVLVVAAIGTLGCARMAWRRRPAAAGARTPIAAD